MRSAMRGSLFGSTTSSREASRGLAGPQRDEFLRKIEVEVVDAHGTGRTSPQAASAATFMLTILSGLAGGSPRVILSTFSMPSMTRPQTVYLPSRKSASSKQMKNWLSPQFGTLRPRHGHGAAQMRLLAELRFQLLAGATHAGAGRIAGLGHEAVDDAMEHHAVIEALAGELLDPRAHDLAPGLAAWRSSQDLAWCRGSRCLPACWS